MPATTSSADTSNSASSSGLSDGIYTFFDNLAAKLKNPTTGDAINAVAGVGGPLLSLESEVIAGVDREMGEFGDSAVESGAVAPGVAIAANSEGAAGAFKELGTSLIGLAAGMTVSEGVAAALVATVALPEIAIVGTAAVIGAAVGYVYTKIADTGVDTINNMIQQALSSGTAATQTLADGAVVTAQSTGSYNITSGDATYNFNSGQQFTGLSVQAATSSSLNGVTLNIDPSTGAVTGTDSQGVPFSVQISPTGTDGMALIDPSTGQTVGTIQPTGSGYTISSPNGDQVTIPVGSSGQDLTTVQPAGNGNSITTTVDPSTGEQTAVLTNAGGIVLATTSVDSNGTSGSAGDSYQTATTQSNGDVSDSTSTLNSNGSITSSSTSYDSSGAVIGSETQTSSANGNGSTTLDTTNYDASGNVTGTSTEVVTATSGGGYQSVSETYNATGNLQSTITQAVDPNGNSTATTTDANGAYSTTTDNGSETVTNSYSASGQLVSSVSVDNPGSADFGYTSTTTDNGTVTVTESYNAANQLESSTYVNDAGTSDPGYTSTTTYQYNESGTLSASTTQDSDGSSTTTDYTGNDAPAGAVTEYNSVVNTYNADGQLASQTLNYVTETLASNGLEVINYDEFGQIVSVNDEIPDYGGNYSETNSYDGNNDRAESQSALTGVGDQPYSSIYATSYGSGTESYSVTATANDAGQLASQYETTDTGTTTTTDDYDDSGDLSESDTVDETAAGTEVDSTTLFANSSDGTQQTASTTTTLVQVNAPQNDEYIPTTTYDLAGNIISFNAPIEGSWDNGSTDDSGSNSGSGNGSGNNGSDNNGSENNGASAAASDGGGYAFASNSQGASGVGIGVIAQYDYNAGNYAAASAAQQAQQQANVTENSATEATELRSLEGAKWGSTVVTWSLADIAGPSTSPFSSYISSSYLATIQAAFATWSAATGITFEQVADSSASDIRLGWGSFLTPMSGVLGYTSYEHDGGTMSSAIVRLEDPSEDSLVAGSNGSLTYAGTQTTLQQLLLHEIGHAIGLADNSDPTSIMYATLGTGNSTLTSADVAAVQNLYSGGSVEGPQSTVDQFDLSGQLESSVVEATDGSVTSTTYNGQGQLALENQISANGAITRSAYVYNEDGSYSETVSTIPASGGAGTTVIYNYDAEGNLIAGNNSTQVVDNPDGSVTTYSFNGAGALVGADQVFVDGSTLDSTYGYNSAGDYVQTSVSTPASGGATTMVYTFNAADQLIGQDLTNADGSTVDDTFTYGADGSHSQTEVDTAAGATTSTTIAYAFNAADQLGSQDVTNTDGSTDDDTFIYGADGSHTQTEVNTAAGATTSTTTVYDFNANGNLTSQDTTSPDGSTSSVSFTYAADGSYTQTEVDTAAGATAATTTVYDFDSSGNLTTQDTANADGSTSDVSYTYAVDGSYTQTEVDTAAGASASTTIAYDFDGNGNLTSQDTTNPNGSTANTTYAYATDGSYTQTEVDTAAGADTSTTIVWAFNSDDQVVNNNTYAPSADGSYTDQWSQADGSSGTYWWNASTREYLDTSTDSSGTTWTDDYQYASGGSPTTSGSSYTETYSSSDGDQGTRQYDASTNMTTITWDSSATGAISSSSSGDSGFVGLLNNGELTNTQTDLTFFNPAASSTFSSFLAEH